MPRDFEDETPELTGDDATMDEAAIGDAGNGANPYGADATGGLPRPIEDESRGEDISPDHIEVAGGAEDDDRELTAQPSEHPPIDPAELP